MVLTRDDINELKKAFSDSLMGIVGTSAQTSYGAVSYGSSTNVAGVGFNDDFNFSGLFKKFEDNMHELMESISHVRDSIAEEAKIMKDAEQSFKDFDEELKNAKNSIASDSSMTDDEKKAALEKLDLIESEKNVQNENYKLLLLEQKYRKQDNELREKEIKFRSTYLDKLKEYEKAEAIYKNNISSLAMKAGGKDGFGGIAANMKSVQLGFGAFAKSLAKGRSKTASIISGVGAGVTSAIGSSLQGIGNFMAKDKVSITDVGKTVADAASNFGPWGKAIGGMVQGVAMMVEEYDKLNVAAQKYVRSVGGGERSMKKMRMQMTQVAYGISKMSGMAYKMKDILQDMSDLSEKTGRNVEYMSSSQFKSLEDLTKFGISKEVIDQYDTFGLSIERIDSKIADIYSISGKHGLNAKAVTDAVTKNLKMAQMYTFSNGVRALEKMAERSVALKMNMSQVSKFADKVSTLEGAMQAGANLSVLGGNFAAFGNPLQMMYEGLNDAEGLMNRMTNMFSSMVKWDEGKGQFDASAYDRQRMLQAAQSMGVDPSEMMNMAFNLARENRITSQLGSGLDKDTESYIKNIATINEKGRAVVTFNAGTKYEETKDISELTMADKARLKNESTNKDMKEGATTGDILVSTRTITDQLNDILDVLKSKIATMMAKIVGGRDEEKAQNMGLNKANAELFEDLSDNYYWGGITDDSSKKLLRQIGMSDEEIDELGKSGRNKTINQDEFDQKIIALLNAAQANGWSKSEAKNGIFKYNDAGWINENGMEINSFDKKLARGGFVSGPGSSNSDSIPARLSNGEFVVNANATAKNRGALESINAQGYANGGIVTPVKNQLNSLIVSNKKSNGENVENERISMEPININLNGTLTLSLNGQKTNVDSKQLLDAITPQVIDYIKEQLMARNDFRIDRNKIHKKFAY